MKKMTKNIHKLVAASILYALANTSLAQEAATTSPQDQAKRSDIEEVVILGQTQQDLAMSAFKSGDFITAEKNFLKNAKCALRRERSQESLVENLRIGSEQATSLDNAQSNGGGSSAAGSAAASAAQSSGTGSASNLLQTNSDKRAEEGTNFTCDNRGFQLYMAGLSQIQLKQNDQALKNFKSATVFSKLLYDAHYRIGLISLMNKDFKESRKQLKKIGRILKKCKKKCDVKEEIEMRYQHLEASIKKA